MKPFQFCEMEDLVGLVSNEAWPDHGLNGGSPFGPGTGVIPTDTSYAFVTDLNSKVRVR